MKERSVQRKSKGQKMSVDDKQLFFPISLLHALKICSTKHLQMRDKDRRTRRALG